MGTIKTKNKFTTLDFDSSQASIDNTSLRKAENISILGDSKFSSLQNIKGTREIIEYVSENTDIESLNVLGVYEVMALYDYDCDGKYESDLFSLLIFKYDKKNKSEVILVDTTNNKRHLLYPNVLDNTDLDFPENGTVSATYTKERGIPEVYWDDNKNELRKITLKISCGNTDIQTARDLSVRKRVGGISPDISAVLSGGSLYSGSYQFAFRFYNTNSCNSSDWSLFSNPVAVALGSCDAIPYDSQIGGGVGVLTTKKIQISISFVGTESSFYNSIQLAVIKNIDGTIIPDDIAYITAPSADWYNNPTVIFYDGNIQESTTILSEIITEDASIESAKTQVIKDNRLFRGGIKYLSFVNDRGKVKINSAKTIKKEIDYKCEIETNAHKGHFREECYAYAVAYFDEFFNFGLIEPLDLNSFYSKNVKSTFTVQSSALLPTSFKLWLLQSNDAPTLERGDEIMLNNERLVVISQFGINITAQADSLNTINVGIASLLYGQDGNQSNMWSWKYPKRSDNKYTILNENNKTQAIGLNINIENHPTWAKGFVILRQKRKENIVFQTPHIPTIAVKGVPTHGIGPIIVDKDNPDDGISIKEKGSDYRSQYDYICPKIFGLGHAKNVGVIQNNLYTTSLINPTFPPTTYAVFYPTYINQLENYSNFLNIIGDKIIPFTPRLTPVYIPPFEPRKGAEIPSYIVCSPPEYVFNNNGEPTYPITLNGSEKIKVIDAVALKRTILSEDTTKLNRANSYNALTWQQYFYTPLANMTVFLSTPNEQDVYFNRLPDLINDINGLSANKHTLVTLSSPQFLLTEGNPCESKMYESIDLYGGCEQLSIKQGEHASIPSTNKFIASTSNQRLILIKTNKKILDFTKLVYDGLYGSDQINYFPNIPSTDIPIEIFSDVHLLNNIGDVSVGGIGSGYYQLPFEATVNNIFTPNNKINSTCYVLNIENGLQDNRYDKISTDWIYTGAKHIFTQSELDNNTPISIDVWGGDCFITKQTIKVNNNTPRISDIYDNIEAAAPDYISYEGSGNPEMRFDSCVKTGSFESNVEFVQLFIESKVNTDYHQEIDEFPSYIGANISNYSKPYFFRYNGGYSINNTEKVFATIAENCKKNGNYYPARRVWSDQRLYQANGNGFVDTDGFSKFRALNFNDLDEKHGSITSMIDFGDEGIHTIQQYKVRFDPINRDIVEGASGGQLVIGTSKVLGNGGYYLGFDNGSQHIRTVKYHNGICYFVDGKKKEVVMFGSKGQSLKTISKVGAMSYFNTLLNDIIDEKDLMGIIDPAQNSNDYWIIKHSQDKQDIIKYSAELGGFTSNIVCNKIFNGVYSGKELYLLGDSIAYEAYTGDKMGHLMGKYENSTFGFVVNERSSVSKLFLCQMLEMNERFIVNKDKGIAIVSKVSNQYSDQIADLLTHSSYISPPPFQLKNFNYWLNRFRNNADKSKLVGHTMYVEFIIVNDEADNRAIEIVSISTDCELSYRNMG